MDFIEKLFDAVSCEERHGNPFETLKIQKLVDDYDKRYISIEAFPFDMQCDASDAFGEALYAEQQQGFRVGYVTALRLAGEIFSAMFASQSPVLRK